MNINITWEQFIGWVFTFGYIIGLLPIILGIIGSMYFRPCNWGLC